MRTELDELRSAGYNFEHPFDVIHMFERKIANYTGAPMAIVVDSCTHAIELCLRYYMKATDLKLTCPKHTYLSVPMTLHNLSLPFEWTDENWIGHYKLGNTSVYDSAVRFTSGMYMDGTDMCLSFQYQKQLKIGKGGAILTDNTQLCDWLKLVRHDGRDEIYSPWTGQPKFSEPGYHYNLIPEDCALGILLMDKLPKHNPDAKENAYTGYPDLSNRLTFLSKS